VIFAGTCGEVPVNIDEDTYEPRIVVDGYLIAGKKLGGIRLTRNYPLNTAIPLDEIVLTDAIVTVTEISSNTEFNLTFNPFTFAYEYNEGEYLIEAGKSYKIDIQARVANRNLTTSSITTVPDRGFEIVDDVSGPDSLSYRELDENGDLKKFTVSYRNSESTESYIASIVAMQGGDSTFIEDNPFIDREFLEDDPNLINILKNQRQWAISQASGNNLSEIEIEWFSIWFYGQYRVILYAADENYTDYLLTHDMIQDIDGNLWEPKFHFEGDGIGVFGSAIADTIYFQLNP
jgi:hypothetical protein